MFERYTEKARRVIFFARYEASQFGSPYIETEHLLLGMVREDRQLGTRFLRSGDTFESIRKQIEQHTLVRDKVATSVDLPLSNEGKRVLAYAAEEAERLSHKHIGTEHLFLGILREENCFAAALLHERGVKLSDVRNELAKGRLPGTEPLAGAAASWLAAYSSRLEGGPLVGRGKELMRLIQVLGRSTRKCAVLVGEPGVGKRSIVLGLARQIATGDAPPFLEDKNLVAVHIARALAGTAAQLETAFKYLPRELKAERNSVLFMEELFELLVRPVAPSGLDAAEILRPLLVAGKVQCISTATSKEYAQAMDKHRWLARCFSKIEVLPATEEETIEVLRGMKNQLEKFHSIVYEEGVPEHAVRLADAHLKDVYFPNKAIDLLDESAAYVKAHQPGLPAEIRELQKKTRLLHLSTEQSVANHEFEKARFYSDEERKVREELRALEDKYQIKADPQVVTRESVEEALALWLGVPVDSIRKPGGPRTRC